VVKAATAFYQKRDLNRGEMPQVPIQIEPAYESSGIASEADFVCDHVGEYSTE